MIDQQPALIDAHGGVELREYILRIIAENDKRYAEQFRAAKEALQTEIAAIKATSSVVLEHTKSWQAASNEWRGAMLDRERTFMTKGEYTSAHQDLVNKVTANTAAILAGMSRQEIESKFKASDDRVETMGKTWIEKFDLQQKWLATNDGREGKQHQLIGYLPWVVAIAIFLLDRYPGK